MPTENTVLSVFFRVLNRCYLVLLLVSIAVVVC
jgi:hypothetical protein